MTPSAGELFYGGRTASDDPAGIRRYIGLVSHYSYLYPDLTVRENLDFFARLYGLPDRRAVVDEAINRAELDLRAESPVRNLSRGMHQRLTIARALLHRPTILLLDEPFTGLDSLSADRLNHQILTCRDTGTATILTTHDLARGQAIADQTAILESGRLVYKGPGKQALSAFRQIYSKATGKNKT